MLRSRLVVIVAATSVLVACQASTDDSKHGSRGGTPTALAPADVPTNVSTLTPYPTPAKTTEPKAPNGFKPVFAENVARHGARSLTDGDLLDETIALWDEAKQAGALTSAGKRFGPDARALRSAMKKVGFGNLSTLGKEEHQAIGAREGKRLSALFKQATADGEKVDIFDSGQGRAEASAENFSIGLRSVQPDLDIEPPESDEKMLKFDNEDRQYEKFLEDGPWTTPYNEVRKLSGIDQAAVDALKHLYKPDFVAGIDDPLTRANGIFDVYRSGPAMSRDVNVDTRPLMPKKAADAFAYVDDGRYFYSRGPGLDGDDGSYQAAQILLDDFFTVIDDHLKGRGSHLHAAVYRFAHAEEITPFAALIGLPGADEPATPGETYTHDNNDFRISRVTPLSANIEWTVWAKGDTHIVSIRHNERPTTVGRDCKAYQGTETFYELDELRTCLGATG
jgi:hypothetical protein